MSLPSDPTDDQAILDAVKARLSSVLGAEPLVFQELIPDTITLDLLLFPPNAARTFWVVSTLGVSLRGMTVPAEQEDAAFWRRAEFLICLPGNWPGLSATDGIVGGDAYFHPMRMLKKTARYPHLAGTFLAPASTVSFPEPLGPESAMRSALIWWPSFAKTDADAGVDIGGLSVNFYQITPIHDDELAFAHADGSTELNERLTLAGANMLYDLSRPSVVI